MRACHRQGHIRWFNLAPTLRFGMVAFMVVGQVALILLLIALMRRYALPLFAGLQLFSGAILIELMAYGDYDSAYKYAWAVVVLLLGIFGLALFLLWGRRNITNSLHDRIKASFGRRQSELTLPQADAADFVKTQSPPIRRISSYLSRYGFPAYAHTGTRYFSLGEHAFEAMLSDMQAAHHCLYLEFFIIFQGQIWSRFLALLKEKAQAGVDVRVIYDDMGSLVTSTGTFLTELRQAGIQVQAFNPVHRHVHQLYFNYRDHRKILAIDHRIAYTGGINLGDEYANLYPKHGHWKDTAVRLEGPGVIPLCHYFLEMWRAQTGEEIPIPQMAPVPKCDARGFVQPFEDGPHNNPENPAQGLYRQMIAGAQERVTITSPYLVTDELMSDALCLAARSGVDVRLVIPHTYDHWYTRLISLSFCGRLLKAGVRIYTYTPGFIHAKMVTVDNQNCLVGTVNLDYRSFYLHYECGVWFAGGDMPQIVQQDIDALLPCCEAMSYDQWARRPLWQKIAHPILGFFAPLM